MLIKMKIIHCKYFKWEQKYLCVRPALQNISLLPLNSAQDTYALKAKIIKYIIMQFSIFPEAFIDVAMRGLTFLSKI